MTNEQENDQAIAAALRGVQREIQEYQAALAVIPCNTLPADYDAVFVAEWTDTLSAHATGSRAAAFLGSFWESHHMLADHMPYERAIRVWFDWAHDCVESEIEDYREPDSGQ
jgi:hypothetical protein